MKPETEAKVRAVFNAVRAEHGDAAADVVDILATGVHVAEHAAKHCEGLEQEVSLLASLAMRALVTAAKLDSKIPALAEAAERILNLADEGSSSSTPPAAPPSGRTLH